MSPQEKPKLDFLLLGLISLLSFLRRLQPRRRKLCRLPSPRAHPCFHLPLNRLHLRVLMAATEVGAETSTVMKRRRKVGLRKSKKPNKRAKIMPSAAYGEAKVRKPSLRMLNIFRKRARDYHSDSEGEPESEEEAEEARAEASDHSDASSDGREQSKDGPDVGEGEEEEEEEEEEDAHGGDVKFSEGFRAFRAAFLKIMKTKLPEGSLGPILAVKKKLVAAKMAEEEKGRNASRAAKKEKSLAKEIGHVQPDQILGPKEKMLISVATKGVVRLFNAVNKAQMMQKGSNPSTSKGAKVLVKEKKKTFLSELQRSSTTGSKEDAEEKPRWALLQDNYMVNSKMKDWDKMPDASGPVDDAEPSQGYSSDE